MSRWWRCPKCGNQNPPMVLTCTEAKCRRSRPDIPEEPEPPKPAPKPEVPKNDPAKPHPNMPEPKPEKPEKPKPEKPEKPKPEEPKKKNPPPALVKFGVWFGIIASIASVVAWFVPGAKPWIAAIVPLVRAILSILGV